MEFNLNRRSTSNTMSNFVHSTAGGSPISCDGDLGHVSGSVGSGFGGNIGGGTSGMLERVRVKYRDKCSTVVTPALIEFGRVSATDCRDHIVPRTLVSSVSFYTQSESEIVHNLNSLSKDFR